jgi:hypothetical protein
LVSILKFIYTSVQISIDFVFIISFQLINFSFKYSLFFFLYLLLISRLKFCRKSVLICIGFSNPCNLACFRWSVNFEHSSSNYGLLWFSFRYPRLSLAEVFIFSLILSQALLMLKLSSKQSKAANLFENSTWYFSLTSVSSIFLWSNL